MIILQMPKSPSKIILSLQKQKTVSIGLTGSRNTAEKESR